MSASDVQRHPEKWVVQQQPDGSSSDMPSITLPRIEEVFSLQDCLQVSYVERVSGGSCNILIELGSGNPAVGVFALDELGLCSVSFTECIVAVVCRRQECITTQASWRLCTTTGRASTHGLAAP